MPSRPADGGILLSVQHDIASMKTRGAGEIGKQAAAALASAAEAYTGTALASFQSEITAAAKLLASARPTAVSLRNGLNFVLDAAMHAKNIDEAKRLTRKRATEFGERVDSAKAKIATEGARLLHARTAILTHCNSSAAIGVLAAATRQGKKIRVYSTETRPFRQGLITSRALHDAGVDVTLIVDSAALHVMESEKVDALVIGADAVAADGSLYNKIGTKLVTLAAKSLKIPVYVCAETYKFSPYTLAGEKVVIEERAPTEIVDPAEIPGVKIHNPVFDRTPPDQITSYVTELGIVKPGDVKQFIERIYGGTKQWI
jgi:ribose 1,5-bisphosphate isomerase